MSCPEFRSFVGAIGRVPEGVPGRSLAVQGPAGQPSPQLNHCNKKDCPGGNCPGCRNGNLWCDDPRCSPNCQDCPPVANTHVSAAIVIAIIVGSLIAIAILIYIIWKVNEPIKITPVTKTIQNPYQQIVTPLTTPSLIPIKTEMTPNISTPPSPSTISISPATPTSPVLSNISTSPTISTSPSIIGGRLAL